MIPTETRKIAIIVSKERYTSYDDYERVIERVTEFEEVDQETYNLLWRARMQYGFEILEQPIDQKKYILDTVDSYKKMVIVEEVKKAEERAEAERKKIARKLKLDMKKKEERQKVFAELAKEFVPELAPELETKITNKRK